MKISFFKFRQRYVAIIALLMLSISVLATDLNWNFSFSTSDIVFSQSGGYTVISLVDGAQPRDAIGAPAIPSKYVNILLPDGATDVSVTATGNLVPLASDVMPWPVQRIAPKSKKQPPFTAPDSVAYASANPWPAVAATYEGVHEMQGSTFVSVRLNPIVYIGSEKTLYYRPSITVTVSYTAPDPSTIRKGPKKNLATEMVNALVVNPEPTTTVAPRSNSRDANTVDYLIITSSALSSGFQSLADYRASAIGGAYSTKVVTIEDIKSSYSGDDTQMKIRNCITDYYNNHGTTYVVLGGDDTIVPDRDTYNNVDNETYESHMPTDLYYSDLTGTWKATGNSNYGVKAANVDMSPEVIVGRIPIRNATQLSGYIAKVQAFEADSTTYTRNSIILGGPAAWCRYYGNKRPSDDVTGDGHKGFRDSHDYVSDSEMWLRRLYRDGIKPLWDNVESPTSRTVNLASDAITSWDTSKCGDKKLTASNLKTWLDNGYTHLMFSGHGFPQGWGMEGYNDAEYSTTQAAGQKNLVAFVYTDACLTGAFDCDGIGKSGTITVDVNTREEYSYTSEPCLGEAFIRNANGGALVHMGCARYGWGEADLLDTDPQTTDKDGYYTKATASNTSNGGPSTVYAYKFYNRLYEEDAISSNRTIGQAFAMSKADMISQCADYGCERWIQFGLNYLGDPAIALYPRNIVIEPSAPVWSEFPADINVFVDDDYELNINSYISGYPKPEITMTSSDYEEATFDASTGKFSFSPKETGTYNFTFSASNSEGSVDVTLTITVKTPPVTVPSLSVTEEDITSEAASVYWTKCDDVTEYTIQLATDELFSTGSAGELFTIVENAANSNTAPEDWTYDIDSRSNSYLILTQGNSVVTEAFDASRFDKLSLSLYMRTYGGTSNPNITVQYSTDNGDTWSESLGTLSASNSTMAQQTLDISSAAGNSSVRLRIASTSASKTGVGIKDIIVGGANTTGGSVVITTNVNDTTYIFTDLTPSTTYYARVKGGADWSNIVSFTTSGAQMMILTSDGDNTEAINAAATEGGKYDVTLQGRTLRKDGDWNTLCLPFNIPISGSVLDGDNVDVRTLSNAWFVGGYLVLDFTTPGSVTEIEAGVPYIVRWDGDGTNNLTEADLVFRGVTIDNTLNDETFILDDTNEKSLTFRGTYKQIELTTADPSILFFGQDNTLYNPQIDLTDTDNPKYPSLEALSAYFQLDGVITGEGSGSNVIRNIVICFGEETTTDLSNIVSQKDEKNKCWYTIDGRRLSRKPTQKGVYIVNGKKVVIK